MLSKGEWKVVLVTCLVGTIVMIAIGFPLFWITDIFNELRTRNVPAVEECERLIEEDFENIFNLDGYEIKAGKDDTIILSYYVDSYSVNDVFSKDKVLISHKVEIQDFSSVVMAIVLSSLAVGLLVLALKCTYKKAYRKYVCWF